MASERELMGRAFYKAFNDNAGCIKECCNCYTVEFFNAVKVNIPSEVLAKIVASGRNIDAVLTRFIATKLHWN